MSRSLADIRDALHRAGLLLGESGSLPEFVDAIADDSRVVQRGTLFLAVPRSSTTSRSIFRTRRDTSGESTRRTTRRLCW